MNTNQNVAQVKPKIFPFVEHLVETLYETCDDLINSHIEDTRYQREVCQREVYL
jgi:hypothetical protein